jgi:hypothetical protein
VTLQEARKEFNNNKEAVRAKALLRTGLWKETIKPPPLPQRKVDGPTAGGGGGCCLVM